jgi:uncharacterized protein (UPF0333 family)
MSEYDLKKIAIGIIILVVILGLIVWGVFFVVSKFNEDVWVKDSKGLWIMHGKPSSIPLEAKDQLDAIECASDLYASASLQNVSFNSQCLGTCGNYSVDIVNVPRIALDDLSENQCGDYLSKKTTHFIELNSRGNIVRII